MSMRGVGFTLKIEIEISATLGAQLQARLCVFLKKVANINRQALELLVECLARAEPKRIGCASDIAVMPFERFRNHTSLEIFEHVLQRSIGRIGLHCAL